MTHKQLLITPFVTLVCALALSGASALAFQGPEKRGEPPAQAPTAKQADAGKSQTPANAPDDPRVAWLRDHGTPLRSIDPMDIDFADLKPLAERIGNARIVLLGEQTHGDGATFVAKCRLVRFLHEVMGFDVLAWESGLFDCREMELALRSPDVSPEEAMDLGLHGVWGASGHVTPVFRYALATHASPRPLEMAGFDCQFSGSSYEVYPEKLFALFAKIEADLPDDVRDEISKLVASLAEHHYTPTPEQRKVARSAVETATARLDRAGAKPGAPLRDIAFYRRTLKNLLVLESMQTGPEEDRKPLAAVINPRDTAMADNLLWLANEWYKGKKLIVWAASFHGVREPEAIDTNRGDLDYHGVVTMGHAFHAKVGQELYSIAFTSHEGSAGVLFNSFPVPPSEPGSLDSLCHDAGHPYLFIDFRALPKEHWLRAPLAARPLGYSYMRAIWPRHFDAMIYIERMFPSTSEGEPTK